MKIQKAAEEAAQREARNQEEGLKAVEEEELDHECLEKLEPKILS